MGWIKQIGRGHDCKEGLPDAWQDEVGSIYECDHCGEHWEIYQPKYLSKNWKKHGEYDPD